MQTITVQNQAHVRPWALERVEDAVVAQSLQIRAAWGTPCVQFRDGRRLVNLQDRVPESGGAAGLQLGGHHYFRGQPYAIVQTGALPDAAWSYAFSRDVDEMLVDPGSGQ